MKIKGFFQPLVLSGVLAAGFLGVWGLVGVYVLETAGPFGSSLMLKQLMFLTDGTPRVLQVQGRGDWRYLDLEGNPVPPPEDGRSAWLPYTALPARLPERASSGDVSWGQRVRSFSDGHEPAGYWYLMTDGRPGGLAYFVGYDSRSKALIGYLGTAGFRPDLPPTEEQFRYSGATVGSDKGVFCTQSDVHSSEHPRRSDAGRGPHGCLATWDVYLLGHGGRLYHIDLQQGVAHVALDEATIRSAALISAERDGTRSTGFRLAVRTADAVLVLDDRDGVRHRSTIPAELREQELHFVQTTSDEAIMYSQSPFDLQTDRVDYRIWWVAADGSTRRAATTLTKAWGRLQSLRWLSGLVVPCPLLADGLLGVAWTRHLQDDGLAAMYSEALARAVGDFWPGLVLVHLLSAGLAVLCYRRQVRFAASRGERVAWPLFVLAMGLPGWVGYRFGRSWPVLEPCPACGTAAPRDRGECAGCDAEFPPPALKGTEVFA
jgi:hypothetical protein